MSGDDIKALRRALGCTPRELGDALGVPTKTVMAWEQEREFPTRRLTEQMAALAERGPGAIVRRRGRSTTPPTVMAALADPEMWRLVRKLIAHPELRAEVAALAERYDDTPGTDIR